MKQPVSAWLINTRTHESHTLYDHDTRIGRDPENDVVLTDDKAISRNHAVIRHKRGAFVLIAQTAQVPITLNGIIVDGPQTLQNDDVIVLGETPFRFVVSM